MAAATGAFFVQKYAPNQRLTLMNGHRHCDHGAMPHPGKLANYLLEQYHSALF